MSADKVAVITRWRNYPVPGTNPRVAWKWMYDAICGGRQLHGFDRLDVIEARIKLFGYTPVRSWEKEAT